MPDSSKSTARALGAVADCRELLRLAQGAAERACAEVDGDAGGVANRLSRQLQFLMKITEVLRHEIERLERRRKALAPGCAAALEDRTGT